MEPVLMVVAVIAAFAGGARWRAAVAVPAALLAAGLLTALNQIEQPGSYTPLNDLVFFLAMVGFPLVVGIVWQARGHEIVQLDRLAVRRREQVAAEQRVARLEEQTRIAARVHHDVIQTMGAIAVHAAGVARAEDGVVSEALVRIETSARETLDALRAHIGLLREPAPRTASVAVPAPAPAAPAVGLLDLLAAGCTVPLAVESVLGGHRHGPAWLSFALALMLAPPLILRRRHPLASTAAVFGVATVTSRLATPPSATVSAIVPVLLLSYSVGAHLRRRRDRALGAALLWSGVLVLGVATPEPYRDPAGLAPMIAWTGLAVCGGILAAGRADRVRARTRLLAEIEHGRTAALRLARAHERHAIARDLHDSIAATMTVVCLHAAAARRLTTEERDGEEGSAQGALRTIEQVTRAGIAELRASLDVLDDEDGPARPEGSLRLAAVLETARAAGMDLHVDLGAAVTSTGVGELGTRVIREALVNAARHAPGARVDVRVVRGDSCIEVEVLDTGPSTDVVAPSAAGTGHGLSGLAERLHAAGGQLDHGPVGTGFRVAALLPPAEPPTARLRPSGQHTTEVPA